MLPRRLYRYLFVGLFLGNALGYPAYGQEYTIQTIAGGGAGGDGGLAVNAILKQPQGIAASWDGSIYVAEASGHCVRRISPTGEISTIAGTGTAGFSGDGGPATAAQLNSPYGLAADLYGNIFIADLGNARLRKVSADGTITTVAGGGSLRPGAENENKPGTSLALGAPRSAIANADGVIYFADFTGHRVFRLNTNGTVATVAGTGIAGFSGDGGPASEARLDHPAGLTLNYSGLYVSDSQNGVVRRIVGGTIDTVVHVTTPTGLAIDMLGALRVADAAAGALLRFPVTGSPSSVDVPASDIALALDGKLYVTDAAGGMVRTIALDGGVHVLAGGGDPAPDDTGLGDGGDALSANLNQPSGVAVDRDGNVFIADRGNRKIRKVTPDGNITTIAGTGASGDTGDGSSAANATFVSPSSVSLDAAGDVYVADAGSHRIRVVTPWGAILPVAGNGAAGFGGDNGPATAAQLNSPAAAVSDSAGNVYIADRGNGRIRRVDAMGIIRTLLAGLAGPSGLALDGSGHLYFSEANDSPGAGAGRVSQLDLASGVSTSIATPIANGTWIAPRGLSASPPAQFPAADVSSGAIFVADTGRQQVLRIDTSGQVAVVAGTGAPGFSGDGGPAAQAQLGSPWAVATDVKGRIFVADLDNGRVRRLDPSLTPTSSITVLNAASLAPAPLAPDMQIAIRNTGLHAGDAASTIVLVNSIATPVLRMDDSQIVVVTPTTVQAAGPVDIVVVSGAGLAGVAAVNGAAASPGLFVGGSGQVTASNAGGNVSTANPAVRGSEVSVLGTGLGLGDLPVTATIGGMPAEVTSVGVTPAFPGTFEVNLRVPENAPAGNDNLIVTVGGFSSQAGAMIAVR